MAKVDLAEFARAKRSAKQQPPPIKISHIWLRVYGGSTDSYTNLEHAKRDMATWVQAGKHGQLTYTEVTNRGAVERRFDF